MQDSIQSAYELFELFKTHSRTSSSGILKASWEKEEVSVILQEGKIIGVDNSSNRLTKKILSQIGLKEEEIKSIPSGDIFDKEYRSMLSKSLGILQYELEKTQRKVENEELQKLKSFKEGNLEFLLLIPDPKRNYVIEISPGQYFLDLINIGFRLALPEENIVEPVIEVIEQEVQKPLVESKKHEPPPLPDYPRDRSTKSLIMMINYHSLTPAGERAIYFVAGLFLTLFCGMKMPVMFSELIVALSDLVKI